MRSDSGISIWFFIGSLLTIYGALILGYGLYSLAEPPAKPPVLAELHADIWWGAVLLILGIAYSYTHLPSRKS
jgi:heme/copper-type cytochrome/quinol oxidase subunit 3